jgi:hypothetical protein
MKILLLSALLITLTSCAGMSNCDCKKHQCKMERHDRGHDDRDEMGDHERDEHDKNFPMPPRHDSLRSDM